MADNYFVELNNINVNEHTEEKGGLTYLSWSWAWAEVKKLHPDATYKVYKNDVNWFYHTDGRTCWVETGVTINGIEHVEMLPVMDFRNNSIPADKVTSTDVNKAIQRSLTKACARHGLGLYLYSSDGVPEIEAKALALTKEETITKVKAMLEQKNIPLSDFEKVGNAKIDEMTLEVLEQGMEWIKKAKVKK